MTPGAYLLGCALLAATVAPAWVVGARVRRSAGVTGPALARLVEAVVALSTLLLLTEVLGTLRLFRPLPVAASSIALGLAAWALTRRAGGPAAAVAPSPARRGEALLALAVAAIAGTAYTARAIVTARRGIVHVDSVYYHLPFAARFVQDGTTWPLYILDPNPLVAFIPANYEALLALVLLPFNRDFLVPLVNLGWLALALLAAWCVGRRHGGAGLAVMGTAAVAVVPQMIVTQAGNADSDIAAMALALAALALYLEGPDAPRLWLVGGLAGGLAAAIKLDTLLLVAALGVGTAFFPGGGARSVATWFLGMFSTAAYWPLRNLLVTGSPMLNLKLRVGSLGFPYVAPQGMNLRLSVADYLGQPYFWQHVVPVALAAVMGPGWALLAVATLGGLVALVLSRETAAITVALGVVTTVVLYAVTPGTAQTFPGQLQFPALFGANTRYLLPAAAFVLVMLPGALRGPRAYPGALLLALYGSLLVLPQLAGDAKWNVWISPTARQIAAAAAAVLVVMVLGAAASHSREWPRVIQSAAVAGLAVAVVAAGFVAAGINERARYTDPTVLNGPIFVWGHNLVGVRIGVSGFEQSYPLFGAALSNRVEYVSDQDGHGRAAPYADCAAWRAAINARRLDYVVLGPDFRGSLHERDWTAADPAATPVLVYGQVTVFAVHGRLDATRC